MKYDVLRGLINDWLKIEEEYYSKPNDNDFDRGYSYGSIQAFKQVLLDINELEAVVNYTD